MSYPIRNLRSGNILAVAMMALFVVSASSIALLMVTANALHLTNKQRSGAYAFNVAESGAENTALWLKNQTIPPGGTNPIIPFAGPQAVDDGTYTATIYPDSLNAVQYLKSYRIVSTGTAFGSSRTVEVVVKQSSFGRYAYFTDKETSMVNNGAIWWKAGETIDGPAHSNNTNGSNFNINYTGSKSPIFLDMVTGSGNSINYSPSRPNRESVFKNIFKDGSKGFKLGVSPIMLPPSTDIQKKAAWGQDYGFPTTSSGVYLRGNDEGGLYICGDADITMSVDYWGRQVVTIVQGYRTTYVTIDLHSGSMSASGQVGSGSPTSTSTSGNGVIYCTGNITSLKGTIADNYVSGDEIVERSAFTIANDVNAGKYIRITDNLVYKTAPDKTKGPEHSSNLAAGTMGLFSKDIRVANTAPANLEINAVMMSGGHNTASGSFYVENYDTKKPVGTLKITGGIIQKARGPVGMFNSSTGVSTSGYIKDYSYDPRLAVNPPPFYPTTGNYERVSWQMLPTQ